MSETNGHWQPNGNGNGGHDREPGAQGPRRVAIHWENMISLRYWFGALFGAVAFAFAVALISSVFELGLPDVAIQACLGGYLVLALIGGLVGRRYWCPHCRGSVKAGATVCRHCGRAFEV